MFAAGMAWLLACGGDVTVSGDDEWLVDGLGEGELLDGDGGRPFHDIECRRCGQSDCGMCAYEGGDAVYQCFEDRVPRADMSCMQTGSVYHGESGSYICWSCFG